MKDLKDLKPINISSPPTEAQRTSRVSLDPIPEPPNYRHNEGWTVLTGISLGNEWPWRDSRPPAGGRNVDVSGDNELWIPEGGQDGR